MNLRPLLFSALFLLVPACSSGSSPGPGDSTKADAAIDAPGDAHASPDTSDAAIDAPTVCNSLPNTASSVSIEQVASDPPAPQGGAIVDGTYALTAAVIYTGPNGPAGPSGTTQTTLQITGPTIQVVSDGDPATRTVSYTTSGTSIESVDTCPDTDTRPGTYTAAPTTFMVELDGGTDDAGARTLVETFTKQ
jgi:hypothetical protein